MLGGREVLTAITLLQTGLKKKLKAEEANSLMMKLLCAILVNDDLEESILKESDVDTTINTVTDTENEHESDDESEDGNTKCGDNTIVASGNKIPILGSSSSLDPEPKSGAKAIPEKKKELNKKLKESKKLISHPKKKYVKEESDKKLCKFFNHGRCNKSNGECKFDHPRICRKFNQFGNKEGINKGCDGKCGFFHPNACRNSLKDRTCT